jgi:hypothetical protein
MGQETVKQAAAKLLSALATATLAVGAGINSIGQEFAKLLSWIFDAAKILIGIGVAGAIAWSIASAIYDRFYDRLVDEKMTTPADAFVRYMDCTYRIRGREIKRQFPGDHCPGIKTAFSDLD